MRYILGFGNSFMGDDGIGIEVADKAAGKLSGDDAESVIIGNNGMRLLDYFTEDTEKVVIVDCVLMDIPHGEYRIFSPSDVETQKIEGRFSTHESDILKLVALAESAEMPIPEIRILGVQPETVEEGCGLSKSLMDKLDSYVEAAIGEILK